MSERKSRESIITTCAGSATLAYGAEVRTRLEIAGVDARGDHHVLTFDEIALRQLAQVLRRIEAEAPGAVRGH